MKKVWFSMLAAMLMSVGAARTASAEPPDVQIEDITYAGSGCPGGSVGASISDNRDSVVVQFDSLIAMTPPGMLDRKNCQVAVKLRFDPSWSFSVRGVNYRGFADLKAGTIGYQKSTYFFQGVPPSGDVSAKTTLSGPFLGDYSRSDDLSRILWSPCGGSSQTLVINAEVVVHGPEGQMSLDSTFGKAIQEHGLVWRKCS